MLRRLFACWLLLAAAAIEFYARRYEYTGVALVPHGALAALALVLLFLPGRLRAGAVALGCVAALLLALHHPFQFLHVVIVLGLLALALAGSGLALLARAPARLVRAATALTLAALNFLLLAYYAILIIGRETWNQVVSRELLVTYFWQLPELIAALPMQTWIAPAAAAGLFLALLLVYLAVAPGVVRELYSIGAGLRLLLTDRARATALVLVIGSSALAAQWVFRNAAYGDAPDPLITTFFVRQDQPGTLSMPFAPDPALLAADREVAARYPVPDRLNRKTLVLITVDALRADQMHVYGHVRRNTPFLSRLQREGRLARFDNAFSVCTESLCGLLAVHASRYWHELGTRNFALADALKRLGYSNHFLLGGDHANFYGLRSFYGLNIDDYFDGSMAGGYMNDDTLVVEALSRLDLSAPAPRFIYLHLMSVHLIGKRLPQHRVWYKTDAGSRDVPSCCVGSMDYANKYHDGILQADALIERIFRILDAKGLLRDAIVAITGDHGEMLGESGQVNHGGLPLDPVVRVPLLIYDTDRFAYPVRPLASVIDIAPTLLDRIGAHIPEHWSGIPLSQPATRRFALMQGRTTYAVVGHFGEEYFKLYRDGDAERLVALTPDGIERALPLPQARPAILAELRGELARRLPARAAAK
ncbi:MAG: sulfatase-like hydrolase/transferase [Betaproteobacteria bacterium]|nr:sulfatase-like hydrolase/transferase [Betaproteobacteria bacterium]MDH5576964.1 sulfatase-like hydrolase/transferase [Betaproteobacteria bacterium]